MRKFLTEGSGADAFGPQQHLAIEASEALEAEIEEIVRSDFQPDTFEEIREERIMTWTDSHPIRSMNFTRESVVMLLADKAVMPEGLMESVASFQDIAFDLSGRLRLFGSQLPRQLAWQIELSKSELFDHEWMQNADAHIESIAVSVDDITTVVDELPDLVAREREIAFEEISRQRLDTLEALSSEREIVLDALTEQREATIAELRKERIAVVDALKAERQATLEDAEAMVIRAVDASGPRFNAVVDHIVWRVIQLVVAAVILAPVVVWIYSRILPRRRTS